MTTYRIYFTQIGVTHKRTPYGIVKASDADAAIEAFETRHPLANIVSIFKA